MTPMNFWKYANKSDEPIGNLDVWAALAQIHIYGLLDMLETVE